MSVAGKKIVLKSWDDQIFEVDEVVALELGTIRLLIEDGCSEGAIPLQVVSGKILSKVIEYCGKHVEAAAATSSKDSLRDWDAEFVNVDQDTLFDLIEAAAYLSVDSLLDLTCQTVADMISGKTPEEIRKEFNIENDYDSAEELQVRRENQWAFE